MGLYKIKKGLTLPMSGEPDQVIDTGNKVTKVALVGDDYIGMKPTMVVSVGDHVKLGQLLFTDKKMPAVKYTAPGTGTVTAINRGEKRRFLSIIIELAGNEEITFSAYPGDKINSVPKEIILSQLIDSGMWTSLRARPFSKVANPDTTPHSIFVTAMDTNPLAPSMEKIMEGQEKNFSSGLSVLSRLTAGKIYLCKDPGTKIPAPELTNLSVAEFSGPHPAGNAGTHIHFLDPVSRNKTVWIIQAQDVIAIGYLFATGRIKVDRIISLAGPSVKNPRLIKTRVGTSLADLTAGELHEAEAVRIVSGSVLSGHKADGVTGFLGRYHQQVSVLPEGKKREFLGWLSPGLKMFSIKPILLSSLFPKKKFKFSTALNGGARGIVPIGSYEKVMPLDILPTYLLRALAAKDVEEAENLGCLELDEEDLALCTFVCPAKIDHGINLREILTLIEKEG